MAKTLAIVFVGMGIAINMCEGRMKQMKEIGIILISHGHFAKYAMDSAQMIVGKVSVTDDKDLEDVIEELKLAYGKVKNEREVLILADIFGGTPSNSSSRILLEGAEVEVYTGFNLPVLLELLLIRDLPMEEIKEKLEATSKETFINLNGKLKGQDSNEESSL